MCKLKSFHTTSRIILLSCIERHDTSMGGSGSGRACSSLVAVERGCVNLKVQGVTFSLDFSIKKDQPQRYVMSTE